MDSQPEHDDLNSYGSNSTNAYGRACVGSNEIDMDPKPVNPQDQSAFISLLPREIRFVIYKMVLKRPVSKDRVLDWHVLGTTQPDEYSGKISLLQTCQIIHQEAETIFYSMNAIALRCWECADEDPLHFAEIRTKHKSAIRAFRMRLGCGNLDRYENHIKSIFETFHNLKHLEIEPAWPAHEQDIRWVRKLMRKLLKGELSPHLETVEIDQGHRGTMKFEVINAALRKVWEKRLEL